jgi:ribosome biogenesis GTPase / thiamine phosphate phosphatase
VTQAKSSNQSKDSQQGLVVSRFGNQADIEIATGEIVRCHIRKRLSDIVCGDKVIWLANEKDQEIAGVVTKILPRETVLKRQIRYEGLKPVAANLDLVCVVSAPEPDFSQRILDRYLVAIELAGIDAAIIINKLDRFDAHPQLEQQLACYQALGYPLINLSAKFKQNLEPLYQLLAGKNAVFVGQSGVGKSSLVNALLPELDITTQALSETSGLGTHTTTVSRLYHLPSGGNLIDSPGIREFTLGHIETSQLGYGFKEIEALIGQCKFRDCKHTNEPKCAVRDAVESGDIAPTRYHSYVTLLEESEAS